MKAIADDAKILDEVRQIIDRNLFPIFAGMISNQLFNQWPRDSNAARDYLRLKDLLKIDRGCSTETLDNLEKYQSAHPDSYQHMIKELETQIALQFLRGRFSLPQAMFMGTGLLLNASPFCSHASDSSVADFVRMIESGQISFE